MALGTNTEKLVGESGYETDWDNFVHLLVKLISLDLSDRDISSHFADKSITWIGRITKIDFSRELSQTISLSMGTPEVQIPDGRVIKADHIVLLFRDDSPSEWGQCSVGNLIRFKAAFKGNSGVVPAIRLTEHESSFLLGLGLRNGMLLEVLES